MTPERMDLLCSCNCAEGDHEHAEMGAHAPGCTAWVSQEWRNEVDRLTEQRDEARITLDTQRRAWVTRERELLDQIKALQALPPAE